MSGAQVLLLLSILGPAASAPLTDREKQNRIVAISESKGSLLSAALSKASPDLLRVALTVSEPRLLKTALTEAEPELLVAALNNVDPDLLTVALTKSDPKLLETALTAAKVELLRTALNAPTYAAILEVALTLSNPQLLAVALQDATVENLIIALTAADGSLAKPSRTTSRFQIEYDELDESDESDESIEFVQRKDIIDLRIATENSFQPSSFEQALPLVVASGQPNLITNPEDKEGFERFPAVPFGALSSSVQTRLDNVQAPPRGNTKSVLFNTIQTSQGNAVKNPTGNGYGALSSSVQSRLEDVKSALTGVAYGALSPTVQSRLSSANTGKAEQPESSLASDFFSSPRHTNSRLSLSASEQAGIYAYLNYDTSTDIALPFQTRKAPSPVDAVPFFIPGLNPLVRIPSPIYTSF